jgi:hypothetical protein
MLDDPRQRRVAVAAAGATGSLAVIVAIGLAMLSAVTEASARRAGESVQEAREDIEGGLYVATILYVVALLALLVRMLVVRRRPPRDASEGQDLPLVRILAPAVPLGLSGLAEAGWDVAAITAVGGVGIGLVLWGLGSFPHVLEVPTADEPGSDQPAEPSVGECAYCGARTTPDAGLDVIVERYVDGEPTDVELTFCSQQHAAAFLQERELPRAGTSYDDIEETFGDKVFAVVVVLIGISLLALLGVGAWTVIRWFVG